MSEERKGFEEAVANMSMASSPFYKTYVFYMHLIAQCKVILDNNMQAPAGVNFTNDRYNLYINPEMFNKLPLQERIGILKHEMLHIALGHILRGKDYGQENHMKFNYAADCALNQEIDRKHLPEGAIYPDNYPNPKAAEHLLETAEFYYSLLEGEDYQNNHQSGNGGGDNDTDDSDGSGNYAIDDHSLWQESTGDAYVQQELTKKMVEKAADQTHKSKGNLPSSYSSMIENLTISREVNWKQVLRKVVGNKKANTRKTLMRRDRRLPFANWIKGKTKDRIFNLAVISDVSGSVSDKALYQLWGEVISICDTYKTPVTLVQVDTEPSEPETLNKDCKVLERKASGGTFLSPAIDTLAEHRIEYDAVVVTTDGYLFYDDVKPFEDLNIPIIWLIEKNGQIMEEMNNRKMIAVKLKE
jgi:predicted metal-dependent peptidase